VAHLLAHLPHLPHLLARQLFLLGTSWVLIFAGE
jgi:hypothetical protein